MAYSEAYRRMRRRADAAWLILVGGGVAAAGGSLALGLVAHHLPVCFWLQRAVTWLPQAATACWGLRLTTGVCLAAAVTTAVVLSGQWWRTVSTTRFQTVDTPAPLMDAARSLLLDDRLLLARDDHPWALTRGFVRPGVVISTGLLTLLDPPEVMAVLAHERYHVLRGDPFRLWVGRGACAAFIWLPPVHRVLRAFVETSELAADAFAMDHAGRLPLASALTKLVTAGRVFAQPAASIGVLGQTQTSGSLAIRVAQIAAFPRAVPVEEDPWGLARAAGAYAACVAAWSILIMCASSLVLR